MNQIGMMVLSSHERRRLAVSLRAVPPATHTLARVSAVRRVVVAVASLVMALKDADADVREQVAFALGQLRDPRAIDALTTALKDASASVRQQAAFALGQLAR